MTIELSEQPDGWGITLKTYLVLIGHAEHRQTTNYRRLSDRTGAGGARAVASHAERIHHWCEANGLPSLATLAVRADSGEPGESFSGDRSAVNRERELAFSHDWYGHAPPTIQELRDAQP